MAILDAEGPLGSLLRQVSIPGLSNGFQIDVGPHRFGMGEVGSGAVLHVVRQDPGTWLAEDTDGGSVLSSTTFPGDAAMCESISARLADLPPLQRCPVCQGEATRKIRCPHYLCAHCKLRTVDLTGRPVRLSNQSMSGGFLATYADGRLAEEVARDHIVLVDGPRCRADEPQGRSLSTARVAVGTRECWGDDGHIGGIEVWALPSEETAESRLTP